MTTRTLSTRLAKLEAVQGSYQVVQRLFAQTDEVADAQIAERIAAGTATEGDMFIVVRWFTTGDDGKPVPTPPKAFAEVVG